MVVTQASSSAQMAPRGSSTQAALPKAKYGRPMSPLTITTIEMASMGSRLRMMRSPAPTQVYASAAQSARMAPEMLTAPIFPLPFTTSSEQPATGDDASTGESSQEPVEGGEDAAQG